MIFLLILIAFLLGMGVGGYIVYKHEQKIISELNKRCSEASERIEIMIRDEEKFISNMHPVHDDTPILKQGNLVNYLKAKYINSENDNLYV